VKGDVWELMQHLIVPTWQIKTAALASASVSMWCHTISTLVDYVLA